MLNTSVPEAGYTPELVERRLSDAGRTLLALQVSGLRPAGFNSTMPVPADAIADTRLYSPPSSRAISAMDQALSWVTLIPEARMKLRHLVNARLLTSPVTDEPIFSWRQLGERLGCSHPTAKSWHEQALGIIARELNLPLFCESAAFGGTRGLVPLASRTATWRRRQKSDELVPTE